VKCMLCWLVTHNQADYTVTFGNKQRVLHVCKWCMQDLRLLGFKANQTIRLAKPLQPKNSWLWVLGPVRNFLEASE